MSFNSHASTRLADNCGKYQTGNKTYTLSNVTTTFDNSFVVIYAPGLSYSNGSDSSVRCSANGLWKGKPNFIIPGSIAFSEAAYDFTIGGKGILRCSVSQYSDWQHVLIMIETPDTNLTVFDITNETGVVEILSNMEDASYELHYDGLTIDLKFHSVNCSDEGIFNGYLIVGNEVKVKVASTVVHLKSNSSIPRAFVPEQFISTLEYEVICTGNVGRNIGGAYGLISLEIQRQETESPDTDCLRTVSPSDGLLEVNIPGVYDWCPVRYISRYNWRDPLDNLICRHFGYINESVIQPTNKELSYPAACMTIINCRGITLTSIYDIAKYCRIEYGREGSLYDNLYKEINCIPAQLVDGPSPLKGRAEAGLFGQLQSICSLGFDAQAANVICASLGYRRGATKLYRHSESGAGSLSIYKRNISCSGGELSLELCNHSSIDIQRCDASKIVAVECQDDVITILPLFKSRPYEGILEGYHGDLRYDIVLHMSTITAQTLCAMLGYGHVGFAGKAIPETNLDYYTKDVTCAGTEKSMGECNGDLEYCVEQRYWHFIFMSNVYTPVTLFCSDYKIQAIRLGPDGILLMQINGRMWATCMAFFTAHTAEVACKIMGYIGNASFTGHHSGRNDVEIIGTLSCNDNATHIDCCHLEHQFAGGMNAQRPYRLDAACTEHVTLTCGISNIKQ